MSAPSVRWSAEAIAEALGAPAPTPQQTAVIEAPLAPALVVAGAGSGKTETMASRVVWLVTNNLLRPEEVLGLTFTRKAATELSERLGRRLRAVRQAGLWTPAPEEVDDALAMPTVSTYHAYAGRLVAEHGLRLGVEPDSRLLSEAACWQLATEVVAAHEGGLEGMEQATSTLVAAVLAVAGELAEHLVAEEEAEQYLLRLADRLESLPGREHRKPKVVGARTGRQLRDMARIYPVVRDFRAAKRERQALDFADQMALAARLARDVPQVGLLERSRFRGVLLDEFQDTSEAQLVLLESLFAGQSAPVTAVGDPHQSIYGWRGASATTLSRFPEAFAAGGRPTPVLALSTSWRNDKAILQAANGTAEPLQESSRIAVDRLHPRPGAGPGRVEAARLLTHEDEATHVARWVRERWVPPGDPDRRSASAAVLCRNRAQFDTVVAALRGEGLPVEVVGLGGLLSSPEVVDLVALLTVAQDPTRGDQLMRLLSGPVCRLGAADVDGLWAWARHLAMDDVGERPAPAVLAEVLGQLPPPGWADSVGRLLSDSARARVSWLGTVVDRVRAASGQSLPDLVQQAERWLDLDLEVTSDPDLPPAWGRAQLDALTEVAAQFALSADRPTLGGFVHWLQAAREHERGLEMAEVTVSDHAVQVLTVHAAKGLEWDVVAVPGLAEGVFPSYTARSTWSGSAWVTAEPTDAGWLTGLDSLPYPLRGDAAGLPGIGWAALADTDDLDHALKEHKARGGRHGIEEERRLAYVALTRARHELLLTAPVWSTGTTPRVTSRFLQELVDAPGAVVHRGVWVGMPEPDEAGQTTNPLLERETVAPWPAERDPARAAGADLVQAAMEARTRPGADGPDEDHRHPLAERLELLLRERDRLRAGSEAVPVPDHLSTSDLVALAADPGTFWRRRRRPLPTPPAEEARRGTAFHAWVERHYGAAALVDVDELPGADDTGTSAAEERLRANFLASPWAARTPVAVEVAVETVLAGVPVRGRIDAVFHDADGRVTIVDWKTGRPGSDEERDRRALQLAAYRLAYARSAGLPLEQVSAVFFYASTGESVAPELPSGAELEELAAALLTR